VQPIWATSSRCANSSLLHTVTRSRASSASNPVRVSVYKRLGYEDSCCLSASRLSPGPHGFAGHFTTYEVRFYPSLTSTCTLNSYHGSAQCTVWEMCNRFVCCETRSERSSIRHACPQLANACKFEGALTSSVVWTGKTHACVHVRCTIRVAQVRASVHGQ
jgi:hypothetical protein